MKQIIDLLVIAATSISANCISIDVRKSQDSSIDFAKQVSRSETWKQLITNAAGSIPLFFKDEIQREANQNNFPSFSIRKSTLTLRDENGNHLSIGLFKNGKVFINDQTFEVHPLENLASELKRVETKYLQISSTKNFFEFLVPRAYAADGVNGVVLASYAVASGWITEQCGNKNLTQYQMQNCPQTAAAMQVSNDQQNSNKFFPVELSCPNTEPNGMLDLISKNLKGDSSRTRVIYSNYNPISAELSMSTSGGPFKRELMVKFGSKNDPVDLALANDLAVKSNALKTNVCEGTPQNRQRYLSALAKNKSIIINASRDNDTDEETGDGHSQQAL